MVDQLNVVYFRVLFTFYSLCCSNKKPWSGSVGVTALLFSHSVNFRFCCRIRDCRGPDLSRFTPTWDSACVWLCVRSCVWLLFSTPILIMQRVPEAWFNVTHPPVNCSGPHSLTRPDQPQPEWPWRLQSPLQCNSSPYWLNHKIHPDCRLGWTLNGIPGSPTVGLKPELNHRFSNDLDEPWVLQQLGWTLNWTTGSEKVDSWRVIS